MSKWRREKAKRAKAAGHPIWAKVRPILEKWIIDGEELSREELLLLNEAQDVNVRTYRRMRLWVRDEPVDPPYESRPFGPHVESWMTEWFWREQAAERGYEWGARRRRAEIRANPKLVDPRTWPNVPI